MANTYSRPPRVSGADRVVPDMPLFDYMTLCPESSTEVYFDAQRFQAMRINENEPDALSVVVNGEEYMSAVGGWVKRWSHWSNRGARGPRVVGLCDMPYIRCFEETDYQRLVTAYVYNAEARGREGAMNPSLDHVQFGVPFDQHWSIGRHSHFYPDLDLETRFRCDLALGSVFVGWHNLEAFSLPASARPSHYVPLPRWWSDYEGSPFLFVATPPVFTYHSGQHFADGGYRLWIEAIAVSEFIVLSLMSFLCAAESGVMYRESSDPRLCGNEGVLLPLGKETRAGIDQMGFLNVIRRTRFSRASAYLAYRRSGEVDWDAVGGETPFLLYDYASGEAFDVPAATYGGTYSRVDGTGAQFFHTTFPAMQKRWLPGNAYTRSEAQSFVQGLGGRSVARGIVTGGQMLMEAAQSSAALGSLREVCTEVGSSVPESVTNALVLARDWLRKGKALSDEKDELARRLRVAEEKLAQAGEVETRIRRVSEGDVLALRSRVEGLELEKATYKTTVSKVKSDIVRLSALRDEDLGAKTAALRERDVAQVQCREGASALVNVRGELANAVEVRDRAVEARDRAVEEARVQAGNVAALTKSVGDNRVFANKCALTIHEVGELRAKIDSMFGAINDFTGLADGVQESSDKLADLVDDVRVSGVNAGIYKSTSVTCKKRSASLTKSIRKKAKVGTPKGGVVTRGKSKGGSTSGNSGGGAAGAGASGAGASGQ